MADAIATTRRALFAIAGAATLLPVSAIAAGRDEPAAEGWDGFLRTLAALHPDLPAKAAEARSQGYQVAECIMIAAPSNGSEPFLVFSRQFGESPETRWFPQTS